jgi:hypothetical protein
MSMVEEISQAPTASRAARLRGARIDRRDLARLLAFCAAVCLVVVGAGLIAAHVSVLALDETLIQQSAVHYTSNFPHSVLHDLDARATNRLYPLVLSVAFRLFNGATAVRVDRVLSVLLFVSAMIPIYLLARLILRNRWLALVVAMLSVVVPWLTLTSALFTENLSYPLFWWMILATSNAVWRPSIVNDSLALISIALLVCTRVQFAAVFPGYVVALGAIGAWRLGSGRRLAQRLYVTALELLRTYPLTFLVIAAVVAAYVYERMSGSWQLEVERLLGTYSDVVVRNGVPANMVEGLLVELIALALGVGLLPAIVSLVWYAKRMARPQLNQRWVYLFVCGIVILSFLLLTIFAQMGYLGQLTEERYFFYVIPVFWLGTFAALRERTIGAGEILGCTVGLAALYGAIPFLSPLTGETAFLAPVEATVPHILTQRLTQFGLTGLTVQDALAVLALVAGAITAYIWHRKPVARAWWTVGAAVVVQLVITGYAFAVIDGKVQAIEGRTGGSMSGLGWVDNHARSANVTWLENLSTAAPPASSAAEAGLAANQSHVTLFWNSHVTGWAAVPQTGLPPAESPLVALPGASLTVDTRNGEVTPQSGPTGVLREVVAATDSPFFQLAGSTTAHSPDGVLSLIAVSSPVRATWLATGLQTDGYIAAGVPARLFAFGPRSEKATALDVVLTVSPLPSTEPTEPANRHTTATVTFGSQHRQLILPIGGQPVHVKFTLCAPASHDVVDGSIQAKRVVPIAGRNGAGTLDSVTVARAQPGLAAHCGG